ncbi:sulfatase [Christiangramia crocea]|uniref:Sulfatase n=1 Tax=Christiangramia crocea TaxID=2904124 RepID=A0A9X1UZP1_9FLAO|nr:sulfatase [Gramella crocea]MCG9972559.1 sulfatase [Gramella crocea]
MIRNKNFGYMLILVAMILCTGITHAQAPVQEKPNILLIIADDLGYTDLGVYGSSFYETPNLDRLARDGVIFTDGYANCPVCSPSRASIQTGKYPVKTGVTDWIKGRKAYKGTTPNDRWIVPDTDYELKLEETTIAEALKPNGYSTAFIGKWHLGETEEFWPEFQGYNINIAGWSKGSPNKSGDANGYFSPYGNPRLKDGPVGEHLPDRLTSETISILQNRDNSKPFFVCLSYYSVHGPLMAKEKDIDDYRDKREIMGITQDEEFLKDQEWMKAASGNPKEYKERIKQANPTYAAMVRSLDENVGRIISYLKENGEYNHTLIVFISDNGGLSTKEGSPTSNLPLSKGKGWTYEGGIRVPFFIKQPDQTRGIVSHVPITGADIFPTLLQYAGVKNTYSDIDGMDLSLILNGQNPEDPRPLFFHYPHYGNQGGNPASAVRYGDLKLIHDLELDAYELYDLENDISEKNNLIEELPEKAEMMKLMLSNWLDKNYDRELKPNPEWTEIDKTLETTN